MSNAAALTIEIHVYPRAFTVFTCYPHGFIRWQGTYPHFGMVLERLPRTPEPWRLVVRAGPAPR